MNKRVALGLAGGLLLVVGLVVGVAAGPALKSLIMGGNVSAAAEVTTPTPSAGAYCQLYIDTVSKDLGVKQSDLQSANKDALQAVINKMYADGKLTQTQKVQAESELAQYAGDPCAALQAIAKQKGAGMVGGASTKALSGVRTALLSAVAGAMKMSSSDLQSQLSAGKTVAQVISAKGANKSAVSAAYLKVMQSQLATAVKNGVMTQAQSTMAYSALQQTVASGHYPLLDTQGGFGGSFGPNGAMSPAGMMWGN